MASAPARAAAWASSVARTLAARVSPPSMTRPAHRISAMVITTTKAVTWPLSSVCRLVARLTMRRHVARPVTIPCSGTGRPDWMPSPSGSLHPGRARGRGPTGRPCRRR